jgi:hypothetical protein
MPHFHSKPHEHRVRGDEDQKDEELRVEACLDAAVSQGCHAARRSPGPTETTPDMHPHPVSRPRHTLLDTKQA